MIEVRGLEKFAQQESILACAKAWDRFLQRQDVGFPQIPQRQGLWKVAHVRAAQILPRTDRVVVVGMGGSILGTKVLWEVFGRHKSPRPFHFLEGVDPQAFDETLKQIKDYSRTHFVLVSKTGSTLETVALTEHLAQALRAQGLKLAQYCTVICGDQPGVLQKWAQLNQASTLPFPEDVGGRFSVLTPAGMFPAALMQLDLEEFRLGAQWALEQKRMVSSLSSALLSSFDRKEFVTQLWLYSQQWASFGAWWQQLWSESLAKKETRGNQPPKRVSTPMTCLGPEDQHSLLQQVFEGAKDKLVIVARARDTEKSGTRLEKPELTDLPRSIANLTLGNILAAEAQALESSLQEAGISTLTISMQENSPKALGGLFMLWQMTIAVMGEVLDIDAFNQPGVELGKRHALQNLRQQL